MNTNNILNPNYTFDNYIVNGCDNQFVYRTCMEVADNSGQDNCNPLLIYGETGLGKTHLMQAIAHRIIENNVKENVLYVTSEQFVNECIDAIKNANIKEFVRKFTSVDVLLVDDVQFIKDKESTKKEFLHIIDTLYANKRQIILSYDKPLPDHDSLDKKIINGFECCVPVSICQHDLDTRMAILRKKAKRENLKGIPEKVYAYIAINITDDIRKLEGALFKASVYAKHKNESLSVAAAKEYLKDLI